MRHTMPDVRATIGVVPGRFQVPALHTGHRKLIDHAFEQHERVLIVLCSTLLSKHGMATARDPLPYAVREQMILETYPNAEIAELFDHPIAPTYWSRDLDTLIESRYPGTGAVLYGSRDSFIPLYSGHFPTVDVPMVTEGDSGTRLRAEISQPMTLEGRTGLIYGVRARRPSIYRTADIAVVDQDQVLLIGKDIHEGLLSFPGGFNDRLGDSDEEAAIRELSEEIPGIVVGPFEYLTTLDVDDPRYRTTEDGITGTFFRTRYQSGRPSPGDDADRVEWVQKDTLHTRLVPWHLPHAEFLLSHWNT